MGVTARSLEREFATWIGYCTLACCGALSHTILRLGWRTLPVGTTATATEMMMTIRVSQGTDRAKNNAATDPTAASCRTRETLNTLNGLPWRSDTAMKPRMCLASRRTMGASGSWRAASTSPVDFDVRGSNSWTGTCANSS